ncbi:MAG: amidohydrolase family protein [Planctomycetes bacterium]|nr:amidohydrolase family protein [Planctomycetota bacterium]
MGAEVLLCGWLLAPDERWIRGGALQVERGRVARVLASPRAVARARRAGARVRDLGEALVAPGFVDAHAHLELTFLTGALKPGLPFGAWVREVVARRAAVGRSVLERAVETGARELLRHGTTTVGDIDTTGASARALVRTPLRHVLFREVLDAYDPLRTHAALRSVSRALAPRARRVEGLSPHAPFTTSLALLAGLAPIARRRELAVSIHWSETEAEVDWLERGAGPLAPLLGPSPRRAGLELLRDAGLLGRRTSLVHGNHPRRGEPEALARAGATLIHCPGCHAWFGREPFPLARYRKAGVRIALGTDSSASNDTLDPRAELARFARLHPSVPTREVWRMATIDAAAALGLADLIGTLAPGRAADFVAFDTPRGAPSFDELVHARPAVRAVWIAGREVDLEPRT